MRLTDRIVSLHPVVVTIVFLLLFFGGGLAVNPAFFSDRPVSPHPLAFSAAMIILIGPLLLWHYSLYRAASDRNILALGHSDRRAIWFVLAVIGLCAFLVLYSLLEYIPEGGLAKTLLTAMAVSMVVGNLSYFAAIWAASNALARFDGRAKAVELHKTLGTFFLVLYLPVGIWALYPRIKRVLAEPISS